ncbi:XRE family transcriptional regulator [Methylomonas sp. MED-D]|uniref:XRE family transcriptional regulator n=1 Tax=unclassified Methylomonas TaxID=2608980 RepID=UPI003D005DB9
MKISDRLTLIRDKLKLTQGAAASKFGIPFGTWKQYERGPSEPGAGALRNLADGGVNIHWLLTGEGEMLLEDARQLPAGLQARIDRTLAEHGDSAAQAITEDRGRNLSAEIKQAQALVQLFSAEANVSLPKHTFEALKTLLWLAHEDYLKLVKDAVDELSAYVDQLELIPFYDVQASAGHGFLVDQELQTGQMAFRKDWLKLKGLQASKCALIKAKGDSMEPTIYDGDLLLVDTSIDHIKDDSIYIVQFDSHLIVKRIQQDWDGSLIVISDNPRYEKRIIGPEQAKEVKIAGRVRWYGHEI